MRLALALLLMAYLAPSPETVASTWVFANDAPFHIDVTRQRIFVDAKVNGVLAHFILDTGANATTLTNAFADTLKLDRFATGSITGLTGESRAFLRKIETLDVNGNVLSNVRVISLDASFGSDIDGNKVAGLLGRDFLSDVTVTVDMRNQTMRVQDPATAVPPQHATDAIFADLRNVIPTVPITIDSFHLNAIMDMGNGGFIFVPERLIRQGLTLRNPRTMHFTGIGGEKAYSCGIADTMAVGGINFRPSIVCLDPDVSDTQGILSYDFLYNFDYVFDYPHSRIYMTYDPPRARPHVVRGSDRRSFFVLARREEGAKS